MDVQITKWLHLSFLFSSRLGRGKGWFEGDSTWLIHYTKKTTKNTDSHPAVLLNSFKFCAPVVFVWFRLFFSCLRRWGRSESMTGRHVFAKMWAFIKKKLHLKCVFANILFISFIKFMFCICFIIIIDLIFVDFRFY